MQGTVLIALAAAAAAFAAGDALPPEAARALPADALLLGEQHDAPRHQRLHHDTVRALAARGQLAALALEMADQGASTAGLPRDAGEEAVRAALGWQPRAWPWEPYAPAVMAAVRAGVPVLGANLPRERLRAAMADASLDTRLPPEALARQQEAVRAGHCDLMPAAQVGPMARAQVARDRAMADTLAQALQPGRTVVLLAGSGHVDAGIGVPRHLPQGVVARSVAWTPEPPARDYCAELRRQMGR
ncbi:ChaN family lipoprotein [Ramlibacter sp. MAHUQ-53]|uniref:ChaN family lipoprotein n=1 Tax=unclassified Ramlibacter TaxID=2617605 RepID=UPI00362C4E8A